MWFPASALGISHPPVTPAPSSGLHGYLHIYAQMYRQIKINLKKKKAKPCLPDVVVHTFNSNTQGAEADKFLSFRPCRTTQSNSL